MSALSTTNTVTQAPKFSRYRSVRRAAAPAPILEETPPLPDANASQLNRIPSRYHRAKQQRVHTVPIPAQPQLNAHLPPARAQLPVQSGNETGLRPIIATRPLPKEDLQDESTQRAKDHKFIGGPVQKQPILTSTTPNHVHHLSRSTSNATRSPTAVSPKSYEAAREEARMILEGEYDRIQKMKEVRTSQERRNQSEATVPKRRPTQIVQQPKPQPVFVDAPKLTVKRKVERVLPEKYHDAPRTIGQRQVVSEDHQRPSKSLDIKRSGTTKSKAPKERGVPPLPVPLDTPKFDAPISAVNAGDRRVEVRLNIADRGITLPVTPTTNSRDLINSASIVMSEDFDPRTSILVETFSKLGLERPLRRYEHIRDVMNSWDSDDQNYLSIMSEEECHATGLERNEAPEEMPGRYMLQMHLSSKPGKWDKRWVILRPDGQVTMSKHENDGEGTNICHLSDFDVYTPTAKERKKLRPPKKICFAVKSQQKSAMFLEGVNFVHFFATSDKQIADQWYTAIQSWRSWYLVHVLGEGEKKAKEAVPTTSVPDARPQTAQSADSVPYQLGSFQPLLDFGDLNFGASLDLPEADAKPKGSGASKKPSMDLGTGRMSFDVGTHESTRRGSRQRGLPPSSFPSKLLSEMESKGRGSLDNNDQAFTGGGLLGRSMSTRRGQGSKSSGQGLNGPPGKPLVDLTPASDFAEGSLLRQLEVRSAIQGDNELKIDRQKRVEADVRVGEGLS